MYRVVHIIRFYIGICLKINWILKIIIKYITPTIFGKWNKLTSALFFCVVVIFSKNNLFLTYSNHSIRKSTLIVLFISSLVCQYRNRLISNADAEKAPVKSRQFYCFSTFSSSVFKDATMPLLVGELAVCTSLLVNITNSYVVSSFNSSPMNLARFHFQ